MNPFYISYNIEKQFPLEKGFRNDIFNIVLDLFNPLLKTSSPSYINGQLVEVKVDDTEQWFKAKLFKLDLDTKTAFITIGENKPQQIHNIDINLRPSLDRGVFYQSVLLFNPLSINMDKLNPLNMFLNNEDKFNITRLFKIQTISHSWKVAKKQITQEYLNTYKIKNNYFCSIHLNIKDKQKLHLQIQNCESKIIAIQAIKIIQLLLDIYQRILSQPKTLNNQLRNDIEQAIGNRLDSMVFGGAMRKIKPATDIP